MFRLLTVNTVEEHILETARFKMQIDDQVIQAGKYNQNTTDRERKEYLEKLLAAEDEDVSLSVPRLSLSSRLFLYSSNIQKSLAHAISLNSSAQLSNSSRLNSLISTPSTLDCIHFSAAHLTLLTAFTSVLLTSPHLNTSQTHSMPLLNSIQPTSLLL